MHDFDEEFHESWLFKGKIGYFTGFILGSIIICFALPIVLWEIYIKQK